jgi:glycerophosphoryl diester phosphodiesterase
MEHLTHSLWLAERPATPLNIAHRGASRIAPQNTLAAFEKALELGADGIEFDVRRSADGVPVVIHDSTVDATTDGTGRVDAMELAQLKRLDAGSSFDSAFAGERIPTLAEVLKTLGGKLFLNIELKVTGVFDRGLEQAVVDLVEEHALEEYVLVASFNPFALRRMQQIAPRIPTGLVYAHPAWPSLRLASLMMPRPNAALHPGYPLVDEQHVSWARARNARIHVWTVDNPAEMRRLIALDVDGIITNAPDLLGEVLESGA